MEFSTGFIVFRALDRNSDQTEDDREIYRAKMDGVSIAKRRKFKRQRA
jgi:hypothetical protein